MKKEKLKVLWAAKTKYPKNWGIKSHKHDCYQLFYIVTGCCEYTIEGRTINVSENDYILVLPNVEHSMQKNHNSLVRMIDIKFYLSGGVVSEKLKGIPGTGQTPDSIRYFFKLISNEIKNQDEYYKEIVEAYTYILVLKLLSNSEKMNPPQIITEIEEDGWSKVCHDVARYIDGNYANDTNLEDISGALGYNKNYLCSTFKNETSLTIMDYLRRVRIERACEMIEMSDYTFSQICFMVGFKSIHHFNRIFKNIMMITPSEYKMNVSERSSAVIQDTFRNTDNYDVN